MAKIIIISGKAESGKDLTASILKDKLELHDKKVLILHYADYLKYVCSKYFEWDGQKDEKGRSILQLIGTDIVRRKDENFWADTVIRFIEMFEYSFDYFIIPDSRFCNEIDLFKEKGFKTTVMRIERLNYNSSLTEQQKQHSSETALDNYSFDIYIRSESGRNNIEKEIDKILDSLLEV